MWKWRWFGVLLKEKAKEIHEELRLQHKCEYSEGWFHRSSYDMAYRFVQYVWVKNSSVGKMRLVAYVDELPKLVCKDI